jgi:hypothetical protein
MAHQLKLESEGGICHVNNQSLADDGPTARHLGNLFEVSSKIAA